LYFCTPITTFFVRLIAKRPERVGKKKKSDFLKKKFGGMKKGCNFAVPNENKVPARGNEESSLKD
jgi:hypothetical protein